jgi:HEPN domain-containing protein
MEKADHDFGSAKLIYLHIPEYFDMIAFHCQQATEKYLKAILLFKEIEFDRTHNLIFLLEFLSQNSKSLMNSMIWQYFSMDLVFKTERDIQKRFQQALLWVSFKKERTSSAVVYTEQVHAISV